ncbi:thiamine-binding protein [Desulfonema ishimotonii]|uniref:Thiamine-binding protein n=1 Tax=Desulfonema ishimotonii TaxID=45657 RepID=A0A401G3K0_9BACT|nr:MTH1187 family thiamine-binding protein [Desulfonema ishimotonii]GBC63810.1 thiamine-binding protein [Desulfonema ishimotonii]
MSVLMEFAMFPTDRGESVSAYVSEVIRMIRDSGVRYQLTPMGTIIETDTLDAALEIVRKAHDILEKESDRIYSTVTFDIRKNAENRLEGKIRSVEEKIGEVNR